MITNHHDVEKKSLMIGGLSYLIRWNDSFIGWRVLDFFAILLRDFQIKEL